MSHEIPGPARRFVRELELGIVCACKALGRAVEFAGEFAVAGAPDVGLLTLVERLHLANGLLNEACVLGWRKPECSCSTCSPRPTRPRCGRRGDE